MVVTLVTCFYFTTLFDEVANYMCMYYYVGNSSCVSVSRYTRSRPDLAMGSTTKFTCTVTERPPSQLRTLVNSSSSLYEQFELGISLFFTTFVLLVK